MHACFLPRSGATRGFVRLCLSASIAFLALGTWIAPGLADEVRTGPAVGSTFAVAPFHRDGQPEGLFVAWHDGGGSAVRSGVLTLEDAGFVAFSPLLLPTNYVTNLTVGVGGSPAHPRAYLAWVGSSLELIAGVFDADGAVIRSPAPIASAVQVVPVRIAGTGDGAIVGHAWDTNAYWDPRALSLDPNGGTEAEVIAENVAPPEQTMGISVSAGSGARYAILYIVSDTHDARLRRFDAAGPLDPAPVDVMADASGDYIPFNAAYEPDGAPPILFLAVPGASTALGTDLRFAHTTLDAGAVTLGPFLSELSPTFTGSAVDMAALAGSPELAVVLWQEIELQDPCFCTTPPPVRVDFYAQAVRVGASPAAQGPAFLVYRWLEGDAIGPPTTVPVLAASRETPGRFAVVWSDFDWRTDTGPLRYTMHDISAITAVNPPSRLPPTLAALLPERPQPLLAGDHAALRTSARRSGSAGDPGRHRARGHGPRSRGGARRRARGRMGWARFARANAGAGDVRGPSRSGRRGSGDKACSGPLRNPPDPHDGHSG